MRLRLKVWHRQRRYVIRQRPVLNHFYRVGVGVIGTLLVLAGMVMIPLPIPGPGWVTFFLGLAILSTEFEWAHRVTSFMRRLLHRSAVITAHVVHSARAWKNLFLDYQTGILHLRTWAEHQHRFGFGQFQLAAA